MVFVFLSWSVLTQYLWKEDGESVVPNYKMCFVITFPFLFQLEEKNEKSHSEIFSRVRVFNSKIIESQCQSTNLQLLW